MKLSIIVPIYNVEPYIGKCLESLVAQDLSEDEYEIVLIDDGSRDSSGHIAEGFAQRNKNIRLFHQDNQGLGATRNRGIDLAKGEYIQFVDADDYLEPNVLGTLMQQVERDNLDVLRFNYQNVNENQTITNPYQEYRPFADYSEGVSNGASFLDHRLGLACYTVQFIIRHSLIADCPFGEGFYYEDTEWTPRMLVKARRVASTSTICYNYLARPGSVTKANSSRKVHDKLIVIDSILQQSKENPSISWYRGAISNMVISILTLLSSKPLHEQIETIRSIKARKIFPLSYAMCTPSGKRKARIINISPLLFCWTNQLKKLI